MRLKHLLLCGATMIASAMLFSCKNAEEPLPSPGDNNSGEMMEYSISVNVPDEIRTKAPSEGQIGESGLYEFPQREINKLWYAVFYENALQTSGTKSNDQEDGSFSISFTLTGKKDLSKLYLLFWAGNNEDKVGTYNTSISDGEVYFAENKAPTVSINNKNVNGRGNLAIYDSFFGYYCYTEIQAGESNTKTVTLKRPFAQIHILSDDFIDNDLKDDYSDGVYVLPGLWDKHPAKIYGKSINYLYQPNSWSGSKNSLSTLYYPRDKDKMYLFHNTLSETSPERTTFKGRKMDYLACYYVFVPEFTTCEAYEFNSYSNNPQTITTDSFSKINFAILNNKDFLNYNPVLISVDVPDGGVKPNNKYIIYTKSWEEGGEGFLTPKYNFELSVITDKNWDDYNEYPE